MKGIGGGRERRMFYIPEGMTTDQFIAAQRNCFPEEVRTRAAANRESIATLSELAREATNMGYTVTTLKNGLYEITKVS